MQGCARAPQLSRGVRPTNMGMNSFLIITVMAAIAICGIGATTIPCPGAVRPSSIEVTDTCVYPASFIDHAKFAVDFDSLDRLPVTIRAKLGSYLEARLGPAFVARLRFREGSYMDPMQVPDVLEYQKSLRRQYVAYVILFDAPFLNEEDKPYCAGVHLDPMGGVVMEIGLPRISQAPQKARVISMDQAREAAGKERLPLEGAWFELRYEPFLDSLIWRVSHTSETQDVTTCNIEAHTGKFVGWTSSHIVF